MPYVSRDASGNITGAFANQQSFAAEFLADNDAALVAFLNPPKPIPDISRRQFYQQLSVQGIITQAEALAALGPGTIPSELQTVVAKLPADQQFAANCFLMSATAFQREHPMTAAIGAAYGWTSDQIDALFTSAAKL